MRWSLVGVLLRRQDDDGLRAGRGSGSHRAGPSYHRRRTEGRVSHRCGYFPVHDLIVADPYQDLAAELRTRLLRWSVQGGWRDDDGYGGVDTSGVFVEIWIGADDKLPRMMRAIYVDDPLQLRHRLEISNWQLDIDVQADAFASAGAANAKRIPFARQT